jgi:rhomboid protease GluP
VTQLLIAANILVYCGQLAHGRDLRLVSGLGSSDPDESARLTSDFLAFGANYAPFVFGERRVEMLMTSCFVHFSLMHIAFNMFALQQVGPLVERTVGRARFVSMYVASGLAGAALSAAWGWFGANPERISAGASGAICGVFGTAVVLGVRVQGWRGPIVRSVGLWLALTIGLGQFLGSDNAAHVGGAVVGAAFAAAWRQGKVYTPFVVRLIFATCTLIIVGSGVAVAVRDLTDPWATLNVDARIDRAVAALQSASCADAIRATERAARIAPRSERVLELKRTIIVGCRRE